MSQLPAQAYNCLLLSSARKYQDQGPVWE
jgi:hypothetical protein